jgi:hypothetical protein
MNDLMNIQQFITYLDEIAKREPFSEDYRDWLSRGNDLYIYDYITKENIAITVVEFDYKKLKKWEYLFKICVSVSEWGQTERTFETDTQFSISEIENYLIEENLKEIAKVFSEFKLWVSSKNNT